MLPHDGTLNLSRIRRLATSRTATRKTRTVCPERRRLSLRISSSRSRHPILRFAGFRRYSTTEVASSVPDQHQEEEREVDVQRAKRDPIELTNQSFLFLAAKLTGLREHLATKITPGQCNLRSWTLRRGRRQLISQDLSTDPSSSSSEIVAHRISQAISGRAKCSPKVRRGEEPGNCYKVSKCRLDRSASEGVPQFLPFESARTPRKLRPRRGRLARGSRCAPGGMRCARTSSPWFIASRSTDTTES